MVQLIIRKKKGTALCPGLALPIDPEKISDDYDLYGSHSNDDCTF